jgi:hypothetical protein
MPQDDSAEERPIRSMRRKRLRQLLAEFGGPKSLADRVGTVDTHLTAIDKGRRQVGDDLATMLELQTGKPFGWMDSVAGLSAEAMEIALGLDKLTGRDRERALATCRIQVTGDVPEAQTPSPEPEPRLAGQSKPVPSRSR